MDFGDPAGTDTVVEKPGSLSIMEKKYDSTQDTLEHMRHVREHLAEFISLLEDRAVSHDNSKLVEPEKSLFDEWSPKLSEMEYGSDEYMDALKHLGPALDHHYRVNSHHPEHFTDGITDMNLFDILEMLADWKAAGERVKEGSMDHSLNINRKRFKIPWAIMLIIDNTARDMGWMDNSRM